jgi:hypothetical protein
MSKVSVRSLVLIALLASVSNVAAEGIGSVTGTSTPQVVTPRTTAAPQTPAQPSPPIGTTTPTVMAPVAPNRATPGLIAPAKPPH